MSVNLGGTLVIYSFLAFFLARLHWRRQGVLLVVMIILAANLFWMIPDLLNPNDYTLCFGNWLVSAFAVILLGHAVQRIPRELEDSARLDGCSWFGIYWHAVLPLVRRDLGFIGFLTLMATLLPLWDKFGSEESGLHPFLSFFVTLGLPSNRCLGCMVAVSTAISLPVIAIFLVAKRQVLAAKLSQS